MKNLLIAVLIFIAPALLAQSALNVTFQNGLSNCRTGNGTGGGRCHCQSFYTYPPTQGSGSITATQ
jgi:hypothetical protein